jgi:agmatinase
MMGGSAESEQLVPGTVAVLGMPTDESSTFLRGAALGPTRIREVLNAGSSNWCAESVRDLSAEPRFRDLGDLELSGGLSTLTEIECAVDRLLEKGAYVLALGGDHAITLPILRAYAKKFNPFSILHLDAHPDLYDEFEGSRYSHACPFARIMEEGLAARLVQVGIRTMNPHQRAQADRFGVEVVSTQDCGWDAALDLDGPVYLSLDMDVLDPAFAPGVAHHEPGGLSTRDVLDLVQSLQAPLVGADIVEFNPQRDSAGITAMAAAKLMKEIADRMLDTTANA